MSNHKSVWRLIDTGLRRAAENMALNKTILEAHQDGLIPHTLRFLQFPPCALVGYHQNIEQELQVDYCQQNGIDIQRRITGGGAIYFDTTQIGWELYLDKKTLGTSDMSAIAARICQAAARGISRLGVNAVFRPRNDIEVDGKKISGTGGAFDGDSILYQGTLLIDFDVEKMLRILRIPAEKLSDKAIASARERVVNLKDLLGQAPSIEEVKKHISDAFAEEFSVTFQTENELTDAEQKLFAINLSEIDTPDWVYLHNKPTSEAPMLNSIYKSAGGLLRVNLALDAKKDRIKQVWITGDFFVNPKRMIIDLEASLKDTLVSGLRDNINRFFDQYKVEMLALTRDDIFTAIDMALQSQSAALATA